jgi:hypothetical protein
MLDCTKTRRKKQPISKSNGKLSHVLVLDIGDIWMSPENDDIYYAINPDDPAFVALVESVRVNGILDPIVISKDRPRGYILSGHRRYAAAKLAGLQKIPCRMENISRRDDYNRFLVLLREHNRQRNKTFDEKLREEVVSANPEVAYLSLIEHREEREQLDIETIDIRGEKQRCEISKAKAPMLAAVKQIIEKLKKYLPLSDRKIHYELLNTRPLIHASKPGSTYCNDLKSYKTLVELLTRARIAGLIPMHVIQDATRPVTVWNVHRDVQDYLRSEVDDFCDDYWRDFMQSQPNHIEIVGEKNTIEPIIRPVAMRFCIPMTIGRGFCSLRPRYDIAQRFAKSGKKRLVLLMLSDFDPDGEEIAHSLARSMRDDFDINDVQPVKVALTADQVEEFDLPPMMQAKDGSVNYKKFAAKYGDDVFELEAVAPDDLQQLLTDAIDTVIDRNAFNYELDQEKADAAKLEGVRRIALDALRGFDGGSDDD